MSRGVLRLFATLVAILIVAEIFSILPSKSVLPPAPAVRHRHYRTGMIHVRPPEGPATASTPLVAAAQAAKLDFVVLVDEETSNSRERGWEASLAGIDFYVEVETPTRAGKVVVFASHTAAAKESAVELKRIAWQHFLGQPSPEGLFLVTSHPSDLKNPWVRLDRFPEGIELVNIQSLARTALSESPFEAGVTAALYFLNPFCSILRFVPPNQKDVLAWDAINSVSAGHFAIAASGIERKFPIRLRSPFSWPPHGLSFRLYANAVFVDNPANVYTERRKQTYEAIAQGKLAIFSPAIFPFEGNDWRLVCGDRTFAVGDKVELPTTGGCEFVIERPDPFPYPLELRVWRDGEIESRIAGAPATNRIRVTAPGAYRVEWSVSLRSLLHLALDHDVSYVIYNPMYLR